MAAATAWRGRRIDPTGYYDLDARYYEPTSGRFLSADPLGNAASPSLYDFCGGDPINHFDPDGRDSIHVDLSPFGTLPFSFDPSLFTFIPSPFNGDPNNWGLNPSDPNPATPGTAAPSSAASRVRHDYEPPGFWESLYLGAKSNLSIVAGGDAAFILGASGTTSKNVAGGSLSADAEVGLGASAYAGVKGDIPLFKGKTVASYGTTAALGLAVGINLDLGNLELGPISIPIPTNISFFVGAGVGISSKVEVPTPSTNITTINVDNDGNLTTGPPQ